MKTEPCLLTLRGSQHRIKPTALTSPALFSFKEVLQSLLGNKARSVYDKLWRKKGATFFLFFPFKESCTLVRLEHSFDYVLFFFSRKLPFFKKINERRHFKRNVQKVLFSSIFFFFKQKELECWFISIHSLKKKHYLKLKYFNTAEMYNRKPWNLTFWQALMWI